MSQAMPQGYETLFLSAADASRLSQSIAGKKESALNIQTREERSGTVRRTRSRRFSGGVVITGPAIRLSSRADIGSLRDDCR